MRELHLFAGVGGGILGGMQLGHECVCAVEIDPYCQQVLRERQADGSLGQFPIYPDVREFDATEWLGQVDVVCGGFPCQPWSVAGKRLGTADPRHLWPEMARIIGECRPRYVFAENVQLKAFAEPYADLRRMGYTVPPALCLSAQDVGAPHIRKRWWLLAHTNGEGLEGRSAQRCYSSPGGATAVRCGVGGAGWWESEPDVGRVANGVPARVDRLRGLGNAQVPACAAEAFRILLAGLSPALPSTLFE